METTRMSVTAMRAHRCRGRISAEEGLALWHEYRATGDRRLRDRLVVAYAPLVRHLAYKRIRDLPAELEIEDLVSAGHEALIASIDRFDPSKGATLEHFAWTRVHGAIVDELRRRDWAPRSVRRWQRESGRVIARFMSTEGRAPTREELADSLDMTVDEVHEQQRKLHLAEVSSLNTLVSDDQGRIELIETAVSDDATSDPVAVVAAKDRSRSFQRAVVQLPARERHVAVLGYAQEMTAMEIGEVLGISKSRVAQLDRRLKDLLRSEFEETGVEPAVA
jgi:RNA polymerase sigma factor for flagellar operon FliA